MNLYKYVSDKINDKLGTTVNLESPRNREFGDFSTNVAMVMAKSAGKNPRELAGEYVEKLAELDFVENASVAGPGFINIKLCDNFIWENAAAPEQIAVNKPLVLDMDYGAYNVA